MFLTMESSVPQKPGKYFQKRPAWTMFNAPAFTMKDKNFRGRTPVLMVSLPEFNSRISKTFNMNDTMFERVFVKLKDPHNHDHMTKLITQIRGSFTDQERVDLEILNFLEMDEQNKKIKSILDIIFNIVIAITMFLCFFSLCSSMSANLLDQTKEIGIMRAMGFTRMRMKFLYFYEAFILVSASCLLGVMIGTIIGFTMVLQQTQFNGIPLTFYFPWSQFFMIMVISMVCAWGSSWGPTKQLVKKEIATIFRSV